MKIISSEPRRFSIQMLPRNWLLFETIYNSHDYFNRVILEYK